MSAMAFKITGISIVCSIVGAGAEQRKHQSSALLAFVRGIGRWTVNSPTKRPVTPKMFPFDDVIISVAYRYRKSISIIELFVSIYIDIYRVLSN